LDHVFQIEEEQVEHAALLSKIAIILEQFRSEQRAPGDPNDISGPAGFGPNGFLPPSQTLPYTIQFENKPDATAPAQVVVVTQKLDPNLDWSTFHLGDFGFAGLDVQVPLGRNFYSTRLDLRKALGLFVDVTAGIDLNTGVATWTFTSVDPKTLDVPADILSGFLPPDQKPPEGEAFINYTIQPKATAATGTRLNAKATVIFDAGLPDQSSLDTAPIFNTIDAAPPTSSVNPLPPVTSTPSFPVSWSGQDDPGGSGIAFFDVYVSTDGGPFQPFLLDTTQTSATFTGALGHTYGFYSVATDNVGNRQATPAGAQASTFVNSEVITATGIPVSATEGLIFNGPVVTFTDTVACLKPTDFTTSIDWGDGTNSSGTVTQPGGPGTPFTLSGSHQYQEEGSAGIRALITHGSMQGNAESTASIADAPLLAQGQDVAATEGVPTAPVYGRRWKTDR
jgi:hypothetical protein